MRPNSFQPGWRAREVAKARERKEQEKKLAEEVQQKKIEKTTTNFPTLAGSVIPMGGQTVVFDASFSSLAKNWQASDDMEQKLQEYRRKKDTAQQFETTGIYTQRFRPGRMAEDSSGGEDEPYVFVPPKVDCDGWQEVKQKARKAKRELTMAEIAQKYRERGERSESGSEGDHNGELFDTNRHDHR